MRDEDRTKEQLIDELVELRRRNAELEDRTGQLIGESAELRRRIAESEEREQPLRTGEILVKMGYVTRQQLEETLKKQLRGFGRNVCIRFLPHYWMVDYEAIGKHEVAQIASQEA